MYVGRYGVCCLFVCGVYVGVPHAKFSIFQEFLVHDRRLYELRPEQVSRRVV